jgi:CHASE3 domain sensor protein
MSPSKNQLISRVAVVVLPILLASAFFFIGRKLYMDQVKASDATRRAATMLSEISDFKSALDETQIRQYQFLLRKDPALLLRYIVKRNSVDIHLALLFCLAKTNQIQEPRLAELASVVRRQLREMDRTVGLVLPEEGREATAPSSVETISIANKQSAFILARMRSDQTQLVFDRRLEFDQKMMSRMAIWTILLAATAIVLVAAGLLILRIRLLQSIITICAWTQRVNYNGAWMRMEDYLWQRFRVKVSHGISEEAFKGVMGVVGKNVKISDSRPQKPSGSQKPVASRAPLTAKMPPSEPGACS